MGILCINKLLSLFTSFRIITNFATITTAPTAWLDLLTDQNFQTRGVVPLLSPVTA